jgi:hypothetical protein
MPSGHAAAQAPQRVQASSTRSLRAYGGRSGTGAGRSRPLSRLRRAGSIPFSSIASNWRRAGRSCDGLVHPHDEAIASHNRYGDKGPDDEGENQEHDYFPSSGRRIHRKGISRMIDGVFMNHYRFSRAVFRMVSAWFPGTIARQIPNGTEKINSDNHVRSKTLRFQ